ncbi:hypothetical protein HYS49_02540 [Candidatus Woesearchaeota archaeon]|nr:hypothetical protein [Candidatus Woesearchaeota archaeon]
MEQKYPFPTVVGVEYIVKGDRREMFSELLDYVREQCAGKGEIVDGKYQGYTIGQVLPGLPPYGTAFIEFPAEKPARDLCAALNKHFSGTLRARVLDICAIPLEEGSLQDAAQEQPSPRPPVAAQKRPWYQHIVSGDAFDYWWRDQ